MNIVILTIVLMFNGDTQIVTGQITDEVQGYTLIEVCMERGIAVLNGLRETEMEVITIGCTVEKAI